MHVIATDRKEMKFIIQAFSCSTIFIFLNFHKVGKWPHEVIKINRIIQLQKLPKCNAEMKSN